MNPELLLLSSQIAALVLLASLLAFGIAWWCQSLRRRHADTLAAEEAARRTLAEQQLAELKENLAATEQQCVSALEQRDEAEREAIARRNETVRLTDQITALHSTHAPREELDRIKQLLTERDHDLWQPRQESPADPALPVAVDADTDAAAAAPAENPLQAEVESLRTERDSLHQNLAAATATVEELQAAQRAAAEAAAVPPAEPEPAAAVAVETLQAEVESLRAERDALDQKLADSRTTLDQIQAVYRESEAGAAHTRTEHQKALDHLQLEVESVRVERDSLQQNLATTAAALEALQAAQSAAEAAASVPQEAAASLETLQAEVESLRAQRDALDQKLADTRTTLDQIQAVYRESEAGAAHTRTEHQKALDHLQLEVESLRVERDSLLQKLGETATGLERLAAEKLASESALQARIDELLLRPVVTGPTAAPRLLTSPRLTAQPFLPTTTPPPPSTGESSDAGSGPGSGSGAGAGASESGTEAAGYFPPAPARADVRDGLFRDADISSLPPDQPSLDDVHDVVARMALELDEKEQVLAAVSQDFQQRQQSLTDLRNEEPSAHDKLRAAEKRLAEAQKRTHEASEDRNRARRHLRAVRRSIEVLESHPFRADNLTLIKGVKNVINSQLHAYGIFTFRQIVQWDEEDLQAFSELLSFKQRIWRDKWQEQARHLHESRYHERLG